MDALLADALLVDALLVDALHESLAQMVHVLHRGAMTRPDLDVLREFRAAQHLRLPLTTEECEERQVMMMRRTRPSSTPVAAVPAVAALAAVPAAAAVPASGSAAP